MITTNSTIFTIHQDEQTLQAYSFSLKGTTVTPMGVVYPKSELEIKEIVAFAREASIALYPICKGKNWGYGSAQGTTEKQLVLDLSKMSAITNLDNTLGYVSIQPGVTQEQLAIYLEEQNSRLQLDVTGAPKDTSLIGNFLERGFGHTDYGNRYNSIINLKVLLPSGKIIQTGFGAFEQYNNTPNIFRQGIGPCLEGLFSQSNLGIVLEMTFKLQPRPEHFCMFGLFCHHEDDLPILVDTLRELRLSGILNSAVHIANQARAVGDQKNPNMGEWILTGSISGNKAISKAHKKALKRAFKGKLKQYKLVFFTDKRIQLLEWIHKNIKKISLIDGIRTTRDLQKGIPTNQPTHTLFSNQNNKLPQFAQDFDANFLWINATCNAKGTDIAALKKLVKDFFELYNHEFRVTFTSITPRSFIMIADIKYARTPQAIAEAKAFYQACTAMLIRKGFYPYRSGSGTYSSYQQHLHKPYQSLLNTLKNSLDPTGIIAPHKYNMSHNSQ